MSSHEKNAFLCSRTMLRLITVTLLVLLSTIPVSAKETKAKAMKISNVEGFVATQNNDLVIKRGENNMVLEDSIRIGTTLQSYCSIKLDDSKFVKLDEMSDVTIVKSGKEYDVYLKSGSVYFDISKKLKSDEALRFHTGDTVTNIVGTIGYIQSDENGINISILEGEANFRQGGFLSDVLALIDLNADGIDDKTGKPIDGEEDKALSRPDLDAHINIITKVPAGTSVSVNSKDISVSSVAQVTAVSSVAQVATVSTKQLTSSDIPGFAAIEIKNSAEAQRRILESGASLNVNQITNQALERLESDSRVASQKLETLQKQKEQERLQEQFVNEQKFVESCLADARAKEEAARGNVSVNTESSSSSEPDPTPEPDPTQEPVELPE